MAKKTQYFSNTSSVFGPMELSQIRPNSRILVLGSTYDYSDIPDIRSYFDLIVSEDMSFNESLGVAPDVTLWASGSPYINGLLEFPFSVDTLMMVNFTCLQKIKNISTQPKTYNLAYIPDGVVGTTPSVTRGVALGLDPLASGVHLAKICGASDVYDTESRSGSLPGKPEDVRKLIAQTTKYGVSSFFKGPRLSLLERI